MSSSHRVAEGASTHNLDVPKYIVCLTQFQGGKLLSVMAERLVEFAPNWRRKNLYEGCIHRAVTTLMMLVIAAKGYSIPDNTKTMLVHWLEIWAAYNSWSPGSMTPDNDVRVACRTLGKLLKDNLNVAMKSLIKQQRRALKCIEVCGLPSCGMETNLRSCVR